jgi:hypothetical protein
VSWTAFLAFEVTIDRLVVKDANLVIFLVALSTDHELFQTLTIIELLREFALFDWISFVEFHELMVLIETCLAEIERSVAVDGKFKGFKKSVLNLTRFPTLRVYNFFQFLPLKSVQNFSQFLPQKV